MSVEIHNKDCIQFMKDIEDNCFNHTITDIPYDIVNRDSNGIRVFDKDKADEITFDLNLFLREISRITKDTIAIFCSTEQVSEIYKYLKENHNQNTKLVLWQKNNPSPVNGQYVWLSGVECCVIASNKDIPTVFKAPSGRSKVHPTEKPFKLLNQMVKYFCIEGDLVFDPCFGSGSLLKVCEVNNVNSVGCEINKEYFVLF